MKGDIFDILFNGNKNSDLLLLFFVAKSILQRGRCANCHSNNGDDALTNVSIETCNAILDCLSDNGINIDSIERLKRSADIMCESLKDSTRGQTMSIVKESLTSSDLLCDDSTDAVVGYDSQGLCADIFTANNRSVVRLISVTGEHEDYGSGFIISNDGYVLTNDHIVVDKQTDCYHSAVAMAFDGEEKTYDLEVLRSSKKHDVALCKFDPSKVQRFNTVKRVRDYFKLTAGADCCVIGNPFGLGLAPVGGRVRYVKQSGNLICDMSSNPGDSGGPVFNNNGECIGINKHKEIVRHKIPVDNFVYATPMDTIDRLLHTWLGENKIL